MPISRRSLFALPGAAALQQMLGAQEQPDGKILAQYYPTPRTVVRRMLEMAALKTGETLFDVGSGDGRIVVMAAQRYGAKAVGVELDADLVKLSRQEIERLGLGDKARIIHGDALKQDYSSADVVTVYLLPEFNVLLSPILEKQLTKGTRVVCHDFRIRDWKPVDTATMDDDEGRQHRLYLYHR